MKSLSRVMKSFQINVGAPLTVDPIDVEQTQNEQSPADEARQLVDDACAEAEKTINDANKMAEKILEDARQQAEKMRLTVLEQAREEGYRQGHEEITQKAESLLKEAEEIRERAQQEYQALLESAEKDIVDLVLDITQKVIGDEVESRPEAVHSLVVQTLHKCKGAETVIIRVSPSDYETVRQNKDAIIQQSAFSGEVSVKKDLSLKSGGCIVETPGGKVDAGFRTQLKGIEEAFNELLN